MYTEHEYKACSIYVGNTITTFQSLSQVELKGVHDWFYKWLGGDVIKIEDEEGVFVFNRNNVALVEFYYKNNLEQEE